MDDEAAKRAAAIQAEVDRQRPAYRAALMRGLETCTGTIMALGVMPMTNSMLISLAEVAAEVIASVPDEGLREECSTNFIRHMTGAIDVYRPKFESGQHRSAAIYDPFSPPSSAN